MKFKIAKANGTQNHFLIFHSNNKQHQTQEIIQKIISQTDFGRIDGVIILSDKDDIDFKMDYYNNDGTWETMCANGARCAVLYAYNEGIVKNKKIRFEAGDGIHISEILDQQNVRLQMTTPKYCSDEIKLLGVSGFHIDSGATHFVVEYPKIDNEMVKKLGEQIRYDEAFKPRGINVNFYEVLDAHTIYVKTYEKGVEDLMMSCGSGSVACAYHLFKREKVQSPLTVHVLGGKLEIEFSDDWKKVWLLGPAEIEDLVEVEA